MVLAVDYRHPVILAKEAATVDLLSGGRLELGLGAGWLRREYESAGLTFDSAGTRIDRLEETVRILDGLFGSGPFSFAGKHYTVTALDGHPKPGQHPRPPILIGGGRRRVLTLAGRVADIAGILTTSVATGTVVDDVFERLAETVAQKLAWVREGAGVRFPDIELSLIPTLLFEEDRERAASDLISARGWSGVTPPTCSPCRPSSSIRQARSSTRWRSAARVLAYPTTSTTSCRTRSSAGRRPW
jgi:probable F420-dependent oxidoreductase